MHNVEEHALQTYQANLKYLETNHQSLYNKINLLNTLMENGSYAEKYALEYREDGYFDVLELSTKEFLYKVNSVEHAKTMISSVDLKRSGGIFKAQKFIYATREQADEIDKSELSFHNTLWATVKIMSYFTEYISPETYMQRVNKIIFLGTGLGLHLSGIISKLGARIVFIQEKNIELFRLSLFTTNYNQLSQESSLHFSITQDEGEEKENFIAFLDTGNNHNLHLKHIPFSDNYQSSLRKLQSYVLSQSYINYGYSAMLLRFIDSPEYITRGYSFLNVNKRYTNNVISNKPVLLLFSGPSTSKNLDWIKDNHTKFIIVSALSTCRLLSTIDLSPDIVIHVDPDENSALLFNDLNAKEYFKDTFALLASNVDEQTLQKFDENRVHFIEQGTKYKKDFGQFSAPSVGEYTYGIFLILGISNLYMLGIDLALDSETLQSHDSSHPFQRKGIVEDNSASLTPSSTIEYVRGNFLDQVPTFSTYKLSIQQVSIFTETIKQKDQNIFNLSNGAYLEGCEPLKIDNLNLDAFNSLNKNNLKCELAEFFADIGDKHFREEDREQISYQVKEAKKLEKVIRNFKKNKYPNIDTYLYSVAKLASDLSDMDYKSNSDLAQIYYEYFSIIQSYIFDLFNTKDLEDKHKHMDKINQILVSQLLKISTLYITRLNKYLK